MDISKTVDPSCTFLNGVSDKLNLELDFELTSRKQIEETTLYGSNAIWRSDEKYKPEKTLTRKKSILSTATAHTVDDNGSSSSDDDEPLTPTDSIGFLPLGHHPSVDSTASAERDNDTRDNCLEKESTTDSEQDMQSIQTQKSSSSSTIQQLKKKTTWFQNLFKIPKARNLFSKNIPEKPKSVISISPPTKKPIQERKDYYDCYTRYPLHKERAIYRSSHLKLASMSRPLHQQVVITNLMYWYLSVLKKHHPHLLNNSPKRQAPTSTNTPLVAITTFQSFAPPVSDQPSPPRKNKKYKPIINTNYNPNMKK